MLSKRLLSGEELAERAIAQLSIAEKEVYLASAFLKSDIVSWLEDAIPDGVTVRLLSRWRKCDLLSGASDLDAYELARKRRWGFYIDQNLHVKALLVDSDYLFVGSSNFTSSGLGIYGRGNKELNIELTPSSEEVLRIKNYFFEAYEMNYPMYCHMKEEVIESSSDAISVDGGWSSDVRSCFITIADKLWVSECLSAGPNDYFSYPGSLVDSHIWGSIAPNLETFKDSRIFKWLEQQLMDSKVNLRFGDLTARLHNSLINDPRPYRREVKDYLKILLQWIEYFKIYKIYQHNHTLSVVNPYVENFS